MVDDLFKGAKEHGAVPLDRTGKGSGEPSRAQVRPDSQARPPAHSFPCEGFEFFNDPLSPSLPGTQPFFGGGYRLGAAPEEESAYVAGERQGANSQQDVSTIGGGLGGKDAAS